MRPRLLKFVPDHYKCQGMCEKAVGDGPCHQFKTQETFEKAVEKYPRLLEHASDHFKTQKMREKAVEDGSWNLKHVCNHFKTQEMCEKAVEKDICNLLQLIPGHLKDRKMCEIAVKRNINVYRSIFLTAIKLKWCVKRQLRKDYAY